MLRALRTPAALALSLVLAPATWAQVTEILDETGDGAGNELEFTNAAAFDAAGNRYISGGASNNVFRVTPAGVKELFLDQFGNGAGSMINPIAIEVDSQGAVFIAAYGSDRVFKVDAGGVVTVVMDATGDGTNPLDGPYGLALDSAENLYVCGANSDNVFRRTPAGVITQVLDASGDGFSTLSYPIDVAVGPADDVYVSAFYSSRVFRIAPSGTISVVIDSSGDGAGNTLLRPGDLVTDSTGNLFVPSFNGDRVFQVTPAGAVSVILDETGDGQGSLMECPYSIDVDDADNLYVAAFHTHNVFRVTPAGEILEIMDITGDGTSSLIFPLGLAARGSGELIIGGRDSDNAFHREGAGPIGVSYCGPANLNSSGTSAVLTVIGTTVLAVNQVELSASSMPTHQWGYFLVSQGQGFVTPPGSSGNLCLAGNIGRYRQDVMNSGAGGTFSLQIDVTSVPVNPPAAIQPGETWNFQAWFRDSAVGSSNFTDGRSVTFQ